MDEIKLYENKEIRSVWNEEKEEWYFSVVDVVGVLTEQEKKLSQLANISLISFTLLTSHFASG